MTAGTIFCSREVIFALYISTTTNLLCTAFGCALESYARTSMTDADNKAKSKHSRCQIGSSVRLASDCGTEQALFAITVDVNGSSRQEWQLATFTRPGRSTALSSDNVLLVSIAAARLLSEANCLWRHI